MPLGDRHTCLHSRASSRISLTVRSEFQTGIATSFLATGWLPISPEKHWLPISTESWLPTPP